MPYFDYDHLYCYNTGPIDCWSGSSTVESFLADVASEDMDDAEHHSRSIRKLLVDAKSCFLHIGWEGDIRTGPFLFFVPDPNRFCMAACVALKQDNNGQTFIASPVELSWLVEDAYEDGKFDIEAGVS